MMDKPDAQRRHLWKSAIILTSVCTAYTALLMATVQQEKEKASWNEPETVAFLAYLLDHKSEIGDSGSFKMTTYNAAAGHIGHLLTQGPVKTGKRCKTKWQTVRDSLGILFVQLIHLSSAQVHLQCHPKLPRRTRGRWEG